MCDLLMICSCVDNVCIPAPRHALDDTVATLMATPDFRWIVEQTLVLLEGGWLLVRPLYNPNKEVTATPA